MKTNKGIAPIVIIAIIVVVAALGYGGYKVATKSEVEINTGELNESAEIQDDASLDADVSADADVSVSADADVALGTSANLSFKTVGDAVAARKSLKCTFGLTGDLIFYFSSDGKIRQETYTNGTLFTETIYAEGKVHSRMTGVDNPMTAAQAQVITNMILGASLQMFTCVETPAIAASSFILK